MDSKQIVVIVTLVVMAVIVWGGFTLQVLGVLP